MQTPSYAARMVAELRPNRIYYGTQTLLTVEVIDAPNAKPALLGAKAWESGSVGSVGSPSPVEPIALPRTPKRYSVLSVNARLAGEQSDSHRYYSKTHPTDP